VPRPQIHFKAEERGGLCRVSDTPPLPCLYKNNCTETFKEFTPYHRRQSHLLHKRIQRLCDKFGIEKLGMLTLTFDRCVLGAPEAQKAFHSFATHVLDLRYLAWIRIMERQGTGSIHYHLVVVLREDIRTGVNFEQMANPHKEIECLNLRRKMRYGSAPVALKKEWSFLRRTAPNYGFGKKRGTNLMPIRSSAEAISRYVAKYLSKAVGAREYRDKGARLVGCSEEARAGSVHFAFVTDNNRLYREKLAQFAYFAGCDTMEDLKAVFGPHWNYHLREIIMAIELDEPHVYDSLDSANKSLDYAAAVQAKTLALLHEANKDLQELPKVKPRPPGHWSGKCKACLKRILKESVVTHCYPLDPTPKKEKIWLPEWRKKYAVS